MTRRLLAVVLAGCLLGAACGDDDEPRSTAQSSGVDSASDVISEASESEDASAASTDESTDAAETPGLPPPGSLPAGQQPPLSDPAPSDLDAHVAVGAFAPAILQPGLSERIVVEVRGQSEAGPNLATVNHVVAILQSASGKKVSRGDGPAIAGGGRAWSSAEIQELADAPGTLGQGGGTAVIRLLFLHGSYGGDTSVLGVAVRGDVAAVFIDQVRASGFPPLFGSDAVETAVTTHEVGHLLGLVDLYRDTGRQDPSHPGHSSNTESVMHYAIESSLIGPLLGKTPPIDFDDADRADLAAIRDAA